MDCISNSLAVSCGGFIAGAFALVFAMYKCKKDYRCIRCIETFALLAAIVTISLGVYKVSMHAIDSACQSRVEFAKQVSESDSDAVLEAYDKLSEELSRWCVLFSILGSFFGLVIPIASYLLQMKEINRKENEIDIRIDEKLKGYKKEIGEVKEEFDREVEKRDETMEEINKTTSDLRKAHATSSMAMMKFVWVEFFGTVGSGTANSRDIVRPIYAIVEALTLVNKLNDIHLLNECIEDISKIVNTYTDVVNNMKVKDLYKERDGNADLNDRFVAFSKKAKICTETEGFTDFRNISEVNKDMLDTVLKFLNEFGIKMFGEACE